MTQKRAASKITAAEITVNISFNSYGNKKNIAWDHNNKLWFPLDALCIYVARELEKGFLKIKRLVFYLLNAKLVTSTAYF